MSDIQSCEHVDKSEGDNAYWFRVTAKKAGTVKELCWDCYISFLRSIHYDPSATVGYHVYRTANPNLPKKEWERLTDKPVPIEQYKDTTREPGVDYYYFNTPVNVNGVEGEPEAAWDTRGTNLGDLDDNVM